MRRSTEGYYQIYKNDQIPGHKHEVVDEIKGLDNAVWLVEKLMRERPLDQQSVSYYRSTYSTSRRKMPSKTARSK